MDERDDLWEENWRCGVTCIQIDVFRVVFDVLLL